MTPLQILQGMEFTSWIHKINTFSPLFLVCPLLIVCVYNIEMHRCTSLLLPASLVTVIWVYKMLLALERGVQCGPLCWAVSATSLSPQLTLGPLECSQAQGQPSLSTCLLSLSRWLWCWCPKRWLPKKWHLPKQTSRRYATSCGAHWMT